MSRIIALCIEDCHPAKESLRYLRCCALTGLQPGLALSAEGIVEWRADVPAVLRLVVSLDEKLVCYREPAAPGGTRVHRGGRFVDVEEQKPVVLIDGDEITVGARRLKLHVHGFVAAAHDPEFYVVPASTGTGSLARAAGVAGVAMAGLMAATGCDKPPAEKPAEPTPIELRDHPPVPVEPPMEPPPEPMAEPLPPMPPIDVRDHPPIAMPDTELTPPPPKEPMLPPPMPPPPKEPVMEPVMEPVDKPPPLEMRPMPPVKPFPMRDDRNPVMPKPPSEPQP